MILYVDTSALVKRYVTENGTELVNQAIFNADVVGISIIGNVETAAAFSKTVRVGTLREDEASSAWKLFQKDWGKLFQIQVTEIIIARAKALVWEYDLRGYDAVHLASAITWQDALKQPVVMAVFDKNLWVAAQQSGLLLFPSDLNAFYKQ